MGMKIITPDWLPQGLHLVQTHANTAKHVVRVDNEYAHCTCWLQMTYGGDCVHIKAIRQLNTTNENTNTPQTPA